MKNFTLVFAGLSLLLSGCSDSSTPGFKLVGSGTAPAAGLSRSAGVMKADTTVVGGAKSLVVPIWSFYLSPNADCTAAVQVKANTTAQSIDFFLSPTLFEETPAAGTYRCMIIEMEDVFTFKPDSTAIAASSGLCVDQTYNMDIYRTDSGDIWKNATGGVITATGSQGTPGSDRVFIFATIDVNAAVNGSLQVSSNQALTLADSIVIAEGQEKLMTFSVDSSNRVVTDGTTCGLNPVDFAIR